MPCAGAEEQVWPFVPGAVWLIVVQKESPNKTCVLLYSAENPSKGSSLIIYDIMNELKGKKFSPKDPDDGMHRIACVRQRAYFLVSD